MASPDRPLRLGTRASPLALAQAHMTRDALIAAHGWDEDRVQIVAMTATGDKIQDRALAEVGGKALWTKELDAALHDGRVDFAVHSMKDVETVRPESLVIAAMLPRADVRDRLIGAASIAAIPQGAKLGTSAPRRRAQMLRLRPDLKIELLRGNVQTRLAKLERGEVDATLLAAAGLARLGMEIGASIATETLLPAPAQGAVGIEALAGNAAVRRWIEAIDHAETTRCVMAERALLLALRGDCRSPVAALAMIEGDAIRLRAEIYSEDGAEAACGEAALSAPGDAMALGKRLLSEAHPAIARLFGA